MYVVPKPGLKVSDPAQGDFLPEAGRAVATSEYWRRRAKDGDVTILPDEEGLPAQVADIVAAGTTAERPVLLREGMFRFNRDTKRFEGVGEVGQGWAAFGSGAEAVAAAEAARQYRDETQETAAPVAAAAGAIVGLDGRLAAAEQKVAGSLTPDGLRTQGPSVGWGGGLLRTITGLVRNGISITYATLLDGFSIFEYGPKHFAAGGLMVQRLADGGWTLSGPRGVILSWGPTGKITYSDLPVRSISMPGITLVLRYLDGSFLGFRLTKGGYLRRADYPAEDSITGGGSSSAFTDAEMAAFAAEARAYSDKVRRRVVDLRKPTAGLELFISYGQSHAAGWETWPALSKNDLLYDNLMMGMAVHGWGTATWNPLGGSATLTPLKATVMSGTNTVMTDAEVAALPFGASNLGETPLEGFAAQFRAAWLRARGKPGGDPTNRFVFASTGVGGMSVAELMPGASPNRFGRFQAAIAAAKAQAAAAGLTFGVGGILYSQGQQDYAIGTSFSAYVTGLTNLIAAMRAEVASQVPGQTGIVPIYLIQTGGQYTSDSQQLAIARAQIEVARTVPGVFIAANDQAVPDKDDHLTSNGSRMSGCTAGKVAAKTLIDGEGFECTRVIRWTVRGRTLVGLMHLPEGEVKVSTAYVGRAPSGIETSTSRGIYAEDGAGVLPIESTQFERGRLVVATLGRDPVGTVTVWVGRAGGAGAPICLSDSDSTPIVYRYEYTAGSGQTADENIADLVGLSYPSENLCLADVQAATAA
ncbi:Protein of unknown function [Roseomonas rosea]|uniref:Uncharacterized protein n=1 Tax=Muricoccus roseus TaxID=198092 RepID=A0A1M6LEC5_9PROT|nr:DUF2635 domain-containing protein [Roseomonas rosea]SHJ69549.1 Protein of unknown function [Roseomonas rosea]